MKAPTRSLKAATLARAKGKRAAVRQQTHRVNVPRSSQRPVERSGRQRSKRP